MYQLISRKQDSFTLLHITDSHLFADKQARLLNVNTWQSFQAVVADMRLFAKQADMVITTGDLSQDGSFHSYHYFTQEIATLGLPCAFIAGNHDNRITMTQAMKNAQWVMDKQWLLGEKWQICLLESQVAGATHGQLSQQQYQWLLDCLTQYADRYTLIALHHPPVEIGCVWLDQHNLHNSQQLAKLIEAYPQIKLVLCGHIHQQWQQNWYNGQVMATPASCFQFLPRNATFALDNQPPGWRRITLYTDGEISSEVFRLATRDFAVDKQAQGY